MKNVIRACMKRIGKRLSPVQYILVVLVGLIGLRLVYAVTVLSDPANGTFSPSSDHVMGDEKDPAKQAILQLMKENSEMPEQVLTTIYNAAARTGNRDLILAICLVESNFNPQVKSHKGAIGLMGIMPGVWLDELQEKGIIRKKEDLYKISDNITAGAHVLATYVSETADLRKALIRYVGGASWYATKVLKVQRKIELAQSSQQHVSFSVVED